MMHEPRSLLAAGGARLRVWQLGLPWLITAGCFIYLYGRLARAAAAEGSGLGSYLAAIFENVSWSRWLMLMIPIRASAYILSIVNEQVSKGAIALYVSRRHGIPAWEVGSSMLFIMFCE